MRRLHGVGWTLDFKPGGDQMADELSEFEKEATPHRMSLPTRLGWVSFFNDCSSEVIARAMPLFLTTSLGMSPTFVGAVEGVAESVSILLRGLSGWISDRMPSRKPLVVFGYGLSVASRILLLAVHVPFLFGLARVFDRTGKGMRSAPRDAMVADAAALGMSGRAFGITRFLDTLGAVTGILIVLALGVGRDQVDQDVFRQCVRIAIPFGLVSLCLLIFAIPRTARITKGKTYLAWTIPQEVRGYLCAVGVFALGNSSDAFLVLRAHELGYSFPHILMLMVGFNLIAAFLAVPVGIISDKVGRLTILGSGWIFYALSYLAIGSFSSPVTFGVFVIFYGAFYGFTEGTEKAFLADLLPPEKRGTGYGALQLVLGVAALPASVMTGWFMSHYGSQVAFSLAGMFPLLGLVILGIWWRGARKRFEIAS